MRLGSTRAAPASSCSPMIVQCRHRCALTRPCTHACSESPRAPRPRTSPWVTRESRRAWAIVNTTAASAAAAGAAGAGSSEGAAASQPLIYEAQVPKGRLEIRQLAPQDVTAACVVMTKAFGTTDENITLKGAMDYVSSLLKEQSKASFLVARLFPTESSLLPPNQTSRIVGVVALAFHPDAMQPCPSLDPPQDGAYLSNMAVDTQLRRQGFARALLEASVTASLASGKNRIYLHVKQSDPIPFNLYSSSGYSEVARDNVLVKLKGIKPRILMKKEL